MGGEFGIGTLAVIGFALLMKVVPIALVLGAGFWFLPRMRGGKSLFGGNSDNADHGERLLMLEGEVARLREELAEVQERQDFAERLLVPERPIAPRGDSPSRPITPREVTPVA